MTAREASPRIYSDSKSKSRRGRSIPALLAVELTRFAETPDAHIRARVQVAQNGVGELRFGKRHQSNMIISSSCAIEIQLGRHAQRDFS